MSPNVSKFVPLYPEHKESAAELSRCQVLKLHRERLGQGLVTTEVIISGRFKPLWGEILRGLLVDALACLKARWPVRSIRYV